MQTKPEIWYLKCIYRVYDACLHMGIVVSGRSQAIWGVSGCALCDKRQIFYSQDA